MNINVTILTLLLHEDDPFITVDLILNIMNNLNCLKQDTWSMAQMGIDKNNIAVREIGNYFDYVEFDVYCYTVAPL